ncbi:MAG TPA: hypothetical protein VEV41_00530 [Terriglobales bacterium]|nr:hypothetical protein [Terriglobales bacterium]
MYFIGNSADKGLVEAHPVKPARQPRLYPAVNMQSVTHVTDAGDEECAAGSSGLVEFADPSSGRLCFSMLLLAMIFLAGILHGLGPDHLAAITAFGAVVGHNFRRVAFFALRFAGGHAVVVAAAALLARFGRLAMPANWERGFDLTAEGLLLLTGLALLIGLVTGHLSIHAHEHHHDDGRHEHFHAHLGSRAEHQHRHGKLAFVLGGLFALGGVRSLLVVVPVALAQTMTLSLLRISAFALGIVVSMSAYGFLAGGALQRVTGAADNLQKQHLLYRLANGAVGIFCIVAGLITLGERLHS